METLREVVQFIITSLQMPWAIHVEQNTVISGFSLSFCHVNIFLLTFFKNLN